MRFINACDIFGDRRWRTAQRRDPVRNLTRGVAALNPFAAAGRAAPPAALVGIVQPHALRPLFFGDGHRAPRGTWRGMACSAVPGTAHQLGADFDALQPMPYWQGPPACALAAGSDDCTLENLPFSAHQQPPRLAHGRHAPALPELCSWVRMAPRRGVQAAAIGGHHWPKASPVARTIIRPIT